MDEIQSSAAALCSWQPLPPRRRQRPYPRTYPRISCAASSEGESPPPGNGTTDQGVHTTIPEGIDLPEEILQLIYNSMPMRDAARLACVSPKFLCFWRRFPNLTVDEETLGSRHRFSKATRELYIMHQAVHVLDKHLGIGVKKLTLDLSCFRGTVISSSLVDGWLRAFVKPGITDLAVSLPRRHSNLDNYTFPFPFMKPHVEPDYTFPYSLLLSDSDDEENALFYRHEIMSIQSLSLSLCCFHPTRGPRLLGCSRSLSSLRLRKVDITEEELGFFLSVCLVLERIDLSYCDLIASVKIPRAMHRLRFLRVRACRMLQMIESDATKVDTIRFERSPAAPLVRFSLGDSLESKKLVMHATSMGEMVHYAATKLPFVAPNLETLIMSTVDEKLRVPTTIDRFRQLKHLVISLGESTVFWPCNDFFSLACFLDACPVLETFILRIAHGVNWYDKPCHGKPEEGPPQHRRREIQELLRHGGLGSLRTATITGFCSAKSLLGLACHVIENAASLRCLTLDTTPGYDRKQSAACRCWTMVAEALREADRALAAVRMFVEPMVPEGVQLRVLGPCSRCHAMDAKAVEA